MEGRLFLRLTAGRVTHGQTLSLVLHQLLFTSLLRPQILPSSALHARHEVQRAQLQI